MPSADNKRIAKNTIMLYIRMAVTMLVSLYTSRVILEALGFVDFGIYGVVGGIVVVFSSLTNSLSSASSRFITIELARKDNERLPVVFSTSAWIHIAMALLIVIFGEAAGIWFLNTQLDIPADRMMAANWLLQFSILSAALNFTQVPYTAAMIAHEHMSIFAYVGLFTAFANLGVAFLIAHAPFDRLIWYGLLVLVVNAASLMISRIYCIGHFSETRIRRVNDRKLVKEMLAFGGYDMLGNFSVMAQTQGLDFVLNIYYGPVLNAARSIAVRMQGIAYQFTGSFTTALRPPIYKLYAEEEQEKLMAMVMRGAIMTFLLVLLIVAPLTVNIHVVLHIWLGNYPDYTAAFCICALANALFGSFGTTRLMVFHASGRVKIYSLICGGIMTMALPVGWLLGYLHVNPTYILVAMVGTTVAAEFASLLLLRRVVRYSARHFFMTVHLKCYFAAVCSFAAGYGLKYLLADCNVWIQLIVSSIATIAVVVAFAWKIALTENIRAQILTKLHLQKCS